MPRLTISEGGFQSLTEHDTEAAWISFLSIGLHIRENEKTQEAFTKLTRSGESRMYVCNNNVMTVSQDMGAADTAFLYEHIPFPFDVTLADATASRQQRVQLSFDNIDRTLVDVLRNAEYPLQINYGLGMVLRTVYGIGPTPPVSAVCEGHEVYVLNLELVNVSWNATAITGTLTKEDILNRAYPSNHPLYEYYNFPALFGLGNL